MRQAHSTGAQAALPTLAFAPAKQAGQREAYLSQSVSNAAGEGYR